MTYGFFMNQVKQPLYSNYFANKNKPIKKINKFKTSTKSVSSLNKSKNSSKVNHKKKKELLEEIIIANSNSIKNNNFFKIDNTEDASSNRKMFTIEKLSANKEEDIQIENEIERRRNEIIKSHKELIDTYIPKIKNSLDEIVSKKKINCFIVNRYSAILEEYTN